MADFYLEGIQEGLASGYFLASDYGWYDGLTEWLPLNDLVAKLAALPPPLPPLPVSPIVPPAFMPLPPVPVTLLSKQKKTQKLDPEEGEITYVLKQPKSKRGKAKPPRIPAWRNDPATEKQISFLHGLGARDLSATLTKGEAHDKIDALLASGNAYNFLTPKQLACLHYYGFDTSKIDYEEAKTLLDRGSRKSRIVRGAGAVGNCEISSLSQTVSCGIPKEVTRLSHLHLGSRYLFGSDPLHLFSLSAWQHLMIQT